MNTNRLLFSIISCLLILPAYSQKVYKPSWESLAEHDEAPEWFQNAKLGIYFHWGVYSVPAFGNEWYPSRMHFENDKVAQHHREKYGDPAEFGYHDFVPMFKAEHFNAEEWADLFKKAGARFAGPVAEHHDGFAMWASEATTWNAADKGPMRDITGELEKAIRAQDMKFITTFHHARNLQRYRDQPDETKFRNSHYPYIAGTPPTSDDSELKYLYGNLPKDQWLEEVWFGKLKEVIDQYHPDIMWFDSWLDQIPEEYRQKFSAYYLNESQKRDQEVVIVRKQDDLPLSMSVDDLEKSRKNELTEESWMTDETISKGSWCYTEDLQIKPAADVLHVLIDIVSKNGVLLLNISPKADGTIPEDQREVLLAIGNWLDKYGESIYNTRPWYTFGEGPTKEPEGHFKNHHEFLKVKYSNQDYRYTTQGSTIYASVLGMPTPSEPIKFTAFAQGKMPAGTEILNVSMLGIDTNLEWVWEKDGLAVTLPQAKVDDMAVVFRVETSRGSATGEGQ
ncbi:MAG: alpha-L-fucosidase [Bacteroidota bacterium]